MGCVCLIVVSMESKASSASIEYEISAKDPRTVVVVVDNISAARMGAACLCICR
jgi:hypothetical protein